MQQESVISGHEINRELYDQAGKTDYLAQTCKGLSEELIHHIAKDKGEPDWMLEHRLSSLKLFGTMKLPAWGPKIDHIDFAKLTYYAKLGLNNAEFSSWDKVPEDVKRTFDRLGIPKAEQKVLAGVGAQYESEVIYHSLKEEWREKGIIFEDMDLALKKHPELVKKYFMRCVPSRDHKFAALHGAVWSGGTFLFVPDGVELTQPLQAYFRMNAPQMGQFEHTLIVIGKGAKAHYIEGCSAPKYGKQAIHAGCVEVFVGEGAEFRYSSVENWSKDTFNLNTKRAIVEKNARMEWVGGNLGSGVTMLYPCSILKGEGATADHLGIAFANAGQVQDTGAKVIHAASHTGSKIVMKSLSKGGGKSVYRGLVHVMPHSKDCTISVNCDALILDDHSVSETFPDIRVENEDVSMAHEATAGKLNSEDIHYLQSRGLKKEEAEALIVNGFIQPIVKELPLEYAVEMNRLIEMEMEGSVG